MKEEIIEQTKTPHMEGTLKRIDNGGSDINMRLNGKVFLTVYGDVLKSEGWTDNNIENLAKGLHVLFTRIEK